MNTNDTPSSIKTAEGTVVAVVQSIVDATTIYHLALKIFDKKRDKAFEIVTFSGYNIVDLPFVAAGDKVALTYRLHLGRATDAHGKYHEFGVTNELLAVSIDWQSAYRKIFKYGDYS